MKIIILSMVLLQILSARAYSEQGNRKWAFHSEQLKMQLDTSWWRQFYADDSWRIRCIFVDMNGDRRDELIALSPSGEDGMGDLWAIYWQDNNGQYKRARHGGDIYFLCKKQSFYKLSFSTGNYSVIGLDMDTSYKDENRRKIAKPMSDCMFILTKEGKYMLHEIKPDLDSCFLRESVVSIERLYPEWYFGYDFKPPKDVPHSVYTQRMPYKKPQGDLRHGGGIGCPKDFTAFAAEYRREVKMRTGKNGKATVYAVFLDADNDGDGDCYVSSDIEETADGEYAWSLYICRGGQFFKAKDAVFPVESRKELCKLPNAVNAGKMSFCRIIRDDVAPSFVILNEECPSKTMVRDAITDYCVHRIEKLDCVEYPEMGIDR